MSKTYTAKNVTEAELETLRVNADDEDLACAAIIALHGSFDGDEWAAMSPSREARNLSREEALDVCAAALNAQ